MRRGTAYIRSTSKPSPIIDDDGTVCQYLSQVSVWVSTNQQAQKRAWHRTVAAWFRLTLLVLTGALGIIVGILYLLSRRWAAHQQQQQGSRRHQYKITSSIPACSQNNQMHNFNLKVQSSRAAQSSNCFFQIIGRARFVLDLHRLLFFSVRTYHQSCETRG